MLTNALLLKISIVLAGLVTLLGLWYHESRQEAQRHARIENRIERDLNHQPNPELVKQGHQISRHDMDGFAKFNRHNPTSTGKSNQ